MASRPNYRRLRLALKKAARTAFGEVQQLHPGESFYAFALHTNDDASYAVPSANTEQGLKRKVAEYAKLGNACDESSIRWNTCDWDYHAHGKGHFAKVQQFIDDTLGDEELDRATWERRRKQLFKVFIQSLLDLDEEGLFGLGEERNRVVLLLSIGDSDQETILQWAGQLNPTVAFHRFKESFSTQLGTYREIGSRKFVVMRSLSLSGDRHIMAVGGWDHILAFETTGYEEVLKKQVTRDECVGVCCCAISPDGKQIFAGMNAGNRQGCIQRWSVEKRKRLCPEISPLPGIVRTIAMSPNGRLVAAGCDDDSTIRIWDAHTLELVYQLIGNEGEVRFLRFSPNGAMLASIESAAKGLRLWDIASGKIVAQLDDNGEAFAFSPDGMSLAVVSCSADDRVGVRLWNIAERRIVRTFSGPSGSLRTCTVGFSTTGNMLASGGGFSGLCQLFDVATGKVLDRLDAGYDEVSDLLFLDGDEKIAVVGKGRSDRRLPVTLWDISVAKRKNEL